MIGFVLSLVAWAAFALSQGFLLSIAVALTGERTPGWGRATGAVIVTVVLWTLVRMALAVFGLFVGGALTSMLSMGALVGVASLVYHRTFGLQAGHGLIVALLHGAMASGLYWLVQAFT